LFIFSTTFVNTELLLLDFDQVDITRDGHSCTTCYQWITQKSYLSFLDTTCSFSKTDKCKLYCSQFALVLAELNLHNKAKVIWQRLHYMTLHDRLTDGQTDRQTLWTSVTVASNAASISVATLQASEGESPVLVVTCSTQHFRGRPGCLLQVSNCPESCHDVTERCRAWWAGAAWSIRLMWPKRVSSATYSFIHGQCESKCTKLCSICNALVSSRTWNKLQDNTNFSDSRIQYISQTCWVARLSFQSLYEAYCKQSKCTRHSNIKIHIVLRNINWTAYNVGTIF